jgi:hypothetical protein
MALGVTTNASGYDADRVYFNYQMFCQGCHTPDGTGARNVPRLKNHVGIFTTSAAGREYLVRVPGSATSALGDEDLADVLNWIVVEFSGDSFNRAFEPYTAQEVGKLRQMPLNEVARYREQLLTEIGNATTGESAQR